MQHTWHWNVSFNYVKNLHCWGWRFDQSLTFPTIYSIFLFSSKLSSEKFPQTINNAFGRLDTKPQKLTISKQINLQTKADVSPLAICAKIMNLSIKMKNQLHSLCTFGHHMHTRWRNIWCIYHLLVLISPSRRRYCANWRMQKRREIQFSIY